MARVIVVEDDTDIASLVAHKLRGAGHDVSIEADGEAGLAAIRSASPDLVILDWMMPRLNGIEVCQAIRKDGKLPRTKVLMLTARVQEADLERSFASGVDEYMEKPFSTRELLLRAQSLLARS